MYSSWPVTGRDDAGRAHVERLQRRPEHALDARELEQHVATRRTGRASSAWRDRPGSAVDTRRPTAGPVARDDRDVTRRRHRRHGGDRLVHALEGARGRCPRSGFAAARRPRAPGRRRPARRRPWRARCGRRRRFSPGMQALERVGDPARLGDVADRAGPERAPPPSAAGWRARRSGPRATGRTRRGGRRRARRGAAVVSHHVASATSYVTRAPPRATARRTLGRARDATSRAAAEARVSTRSTSKPWRGELDGVVDDHADASRELQVLGQEGHAHGRAIVALCPLRVAFLGPAATFGAHAMHVAADGVEPFFVDVRRRAVRASPPSTPRRRGRARPPTDAPPAPRRGHAGRDRPGRPGAGRASTASCAPPARARRGAWRSRPLPVDDRLFARPDAPRSGRRERSSSAARPPIASGSSRPPSTTTTSCTTRTASIGEALAERAAQRRRRHRAQRASPSHGFPLAGAAAPRRRPAAALRAPAPRLRPGARDRLPRDRLARPPADAADAAALAPGRLRARPRARSPEGRSSTAHPASGRGSRRTSWRTCASSAVIPWKRERAHPSRRRRRRVEDVRAPARARPDAQGARAAPAAPDPDRHAARAARRQLRRRAGRVLRDRRPQRLGQVDAAEVPGRDLRRRPRRHLPRRAALAPSSSSASASAWTCRRATT